MDSNRRVVLIGLENPDGSLSGSLQVLETLAGLRVEPAGDVKERNLVRRTLSDAGAVIGAKNYDLTVPVELKGGGIDTDVVQQPPMHSALIASGMILDAAKMVVVSSITGTFEPGETVTNTTAANTTGTVAHVVDNGDSTSTLWIYALQTAPAAADQLTGDTSGATATVDSLDDALCYRLTSDRTQYSTCQIHTHMDGTRRVARRGLASFQFDWTAGEYATLQFTVKALYERPTDETLPGAEYSEILPPIGQSAGLSIEGYPGGTIEKLGFNLSNEIVPVPDINSADGRESFRIRGRKPTGGVDPEVVQLSQFNPFTLWENGTRAPIHATLGSTPGERISVVVTAAQFTGIQDKERAGMDAYDLSYRATGTADDEFFLFFH